MAKVTKFRTKAMKEAVKLVGLKDGDFKPYVDDRRQSATIELAEKLLADCKAGNVQAFAVARVHGDAPNYTSSSSAIASTWKEPGDWGLPTPLIHKLLLASIEEMRHEFKHALRGG